MLRLTRIEALLALWLKELEFRNVKVPMAYTQLPADAQRNGEWGETCTDVEIWFRGDRVTDVKLEIQAFREDYMVATASSNIEVDLAAFKELSVKEDVYPKQ